MAKNTLIFFVFLVLSLVVTWPLILNLNTLIIDTHDGLLITWIINWFSHAASFRGNIFYPYHGTMAFSDFHLASVILAAPFLWIFKEPLLAFNINLILGFTLTSFSTYLLVKFLTKKEPVSFFAGILLSFSIIHLNYMSHLQLFHLWLIIFPLLFLFQNKFKTFLFSCTLAVLNSPLNFFFLLFFGVVLRRNILWFLISATLSSVFLIPYLRVSEIFKYTRPITDAIHFSLQLPDIWNVSIYSHLSKIISQNPGTPAYFGAVFFLMALITFRKIKSSVWAYGALGSFILSLGPALHLFRNTIHIGPIPFIPLPYAFFYYLLPGFSGFRTPSRWILVTALCLVLAITTSFSKKLSWIWAISFSVLIILEINLPFTYYKVPAIKDFPPEQVWLKTNYAGVPIIQFPIYGWFDGDKIGVETLREYYSTIHWHPMFNGYSGYSPTEWEEKVKWLQKEFPSKSAYDYLQKLGVVLVLAPKDWPVELKLIQTFPGVNIYHL